MKIICVGRNYREHTKELNNPVPSEPVIFLKPDTSLLRPGQDFYLPNNLGIVDYELELLLKISKEGKWIQEKFAGKYFEEIGLGIDFTARDKQAELKSKGLPWELAKSFDGSAAIGSFISKSELNSMDNLTFNLLKNGSVVQAGKSSELIFSFEKIISFVSTFITLRKGDLIYTGTPAGTGKVEPGDILEGYLENHKLLEVKIK